MDGDVPAELWRPHGSWAKARVPEGGTPLHQPSFWEVRWDWRGNMRFWVTHEQVKLYIINRGRELQRKGGPVSACLPITPHASLGALQAHSSLVRDLKLVEGPWARGRHEILALRNGVTVGYLLSAYYVLGSVLGTEQTFEGNTPIRAFPSEMWSSSLSIPWEGARLAESQARPRWAGPRPGFEDHCSRK